MLRAYERKIRTDRLAAVSNPPAGTRETEVSPEISGQ